MREGFSSKPSTPFFSFAWNMAPLLKGAALLPSPFFRSGPSGGAGLEVDDPPC